MAQLVGARSAAAADSALAGLQGGIGSAIAALRLQALTLLADIEVTCQPASAAMLHGILIGAQLIAHGVQGVDSSHVQGLAGTMYVQGSWLHWRAAGSKLCGMMHLSVQCNGRRRCRL